MGWPRQLVRHPPVDEAGYNGDMTLTISRAGLDCILAHVRRELPREACGLLGGVGGRVMAVYPIPNVAADPFVEFRMDGKAQVDAMVDIEGRGWNILAIYHSHPCGERSEPSPTDTDRAYYPEALALIVAADLSVRAFAIRDGRVDEAPIHVV